MEKLPAELRLEIFRLALRSDSSVVQTKERDHDANAAKRLETSLFTVNREISREAQDAFFEINTMSTYSFTPEYPRMKLVRHLELKNQDLVSMLNQPLFFYNCMLDLFYRLPHLRNVSIACDYILKLGLAVHEHFSLSAEAKAHGIGVFELAPKFPLQGKIWAKDVELLSTLPQAKLVASSYSLEELYRFSLRGVCPPRGPACGTSKRQISFAFYLGSFESMRRLGKEPSLSDSDDEHASIFRAINLGPHETFVETRGLPLLHEELPDDVELTELSLTKGHSPKLVGWASDVLGHLLHRISSSPGPRR